MYQIRNPLCVTYYVVIGKIIGKITCGQFTYLFEQYHKVYLYFGVKFLVTKIYLVK